jgi:peptidoglycan-N-acetylglucosamine deacetylase
MSGARQRDVVPPLAVAPDSVAPPATAPQRSSFRLSIGLRLWLALKAVALGLAIARHPWAAALAYLILDPWFLWQIIVPSSNGFGPVVSRFATDKREVWLTIDDGPDPVTTPRLLDLLDEFGARATFFVIGQQVESHPELAREIARRGHTLANHTHSHPSWRLWRSGKTQILAEMDRCAAALTRLGVEAPPYFRLPVGIKNPWVHPALAERGLLLVAWAARGYDCISTEEKATQRITKDITPGAVVLLHEGGSDLKRVSVVRRVLEFLRANGYSTTLPASTDLIT